MTSRVCPTRPARMSYGPLPGKPRIAAEVPVLTGSAIVSAGAFRPGTRSTARSFLGSKETACASSPGWRPRSSTRVSFCPATTCALVTTSSSPATQPEPSTPSPQALPRILTTELRGRRGRRGVRAIEAVGARTLASGPSMRGNGSSRASAESRPVRGREDRVELLQDCGALHLAAGLTAVGQRQRAKHPRDAQTDDRGQRRAQDPVDRGRAPERPASTPAAASRCPRSRSRTPSRRSAHRPARRPETTASGARRRAAAARRASPPRRRGEAEQRQRARHEPLRPAEQAQQAR